MNKKDINMCGGVMKKVGGLLVATMLIAPMAGVITSCSDDNTYEAAAVPDNHQVYFNYADNNTFSIEENQSSVSVNVYRIDTSGALSVPYTAVQPEGQTDIFVLPQTIDFADGQSVANFQIGIDFSKVVSRESYTLDLTIDESEQTLYGDNSCTVTVEYYEKGDPMRDAICGNYNGAGEGGQYWSNPFIYTGWSMTYGEDGNTPVRLVPGEAKNEVYLRNLLPDNDCTDISDIVGTVYTFETEADARTWWGMDDTSTTWSTFWGDGYQLLGYIEVLPQKVGTLTLNYYGTYTYDLSFAAAWATGNWTTSPSDTLYVPIVGLRNADGSTTVKQIDFTTNGWAMLFGYQEYGAWYYCAYGYGVLDLQ